MNMFSGWCSTKCKLMSTQVLCLHKSLVVKSAPCVPLFAFHYLKTECRHFVKHVDREFMLTITITIYTP